MKFIDWVLHLPETLDKEIRKSLNEDQEAVMAYIPSFVREAHEEGKLEGKRELLQSQLEQRFGVLPKWALGKIARASETTLDTWSREILNGTSNLERFLTDA